MTPAEAHDLVGRGAGALAGWLGKTPAAAVVLGSGFQGAMAHFKTLAELDFAQIPCFSPTTVEGHTGKLALAEAEGTTFLAVCGRRHHYEGLSMVEVSLPTRALAEAGVRSLLLTNAAGGIHPKLRPGGFMVLRDHINFMGENPLRGWPGGAGGRFVDLSAVYDEKLRAGLMAAAAAEGVECREGVYLAVSGPSYETPAEIRMFAAWGADAVGMSTVPEAVVARQCGLRVAGLSCVTNRAAGLAAEPLSHAEVLAAGRAGARPASRLIARFMADAT